MGPSASRRCIARVPFGKLACAIWLVSSGMGSSDWACNDILILLHIFMKHFLMTCFPLLYALLLSLSTCPDKISQQSHEFVVGKQPTNRRARFIATSADLSASRKPPT